MRRAVLRRAGPSPRPPTSPSTSPPASPRPHLRGDFRCSIHGELRRRGFPGCASYDCFGAGQHVSQGTFGGLDWRQAPAVKAGMLAAFAVMRPLHELLWYLTEAFSLNAARPLQ